MNKYMKAAVEAAKEGVQNKSGGPFGAVIVKDGNIVATACNEVIKSNDPTAHAEILAIRRASEELERFDLSDCEIYTSCEPCPMCFSAIHWARIKNVFYGCTREDAAKEGFDDELFYKAVRGEVKLLEMKNIDREYCLEAFELWDNLSNKTVY